MEVLTDGGLDVLDPHLFQPGLLGLDGRVLKRLELLQFARVFEIQFKDALALAL